MQSSEQRMIAHYYLVRRVAQGGMSEVYLALDTRDNQAVAIKVIDGRQHGSDEHFLHEVKSLTTLIHDHVLPIFDHGQDGGQRYIVMPFIEDGTLRDRLATSRLSPQEAGRILTQLADALQFAHERGMLHCDIKPSNILLRDGQHVYLTDFGSGKHLIDAESDITQTVALTGTPAYMAPELAHEPASVRSDVYAVGVLLYQMLTGQLPFKSDTVLGVYWQHAHAQPVRPSVLNAAISPEVESVVLRALHKRADQRFETIQKLSQAYQQALRQPRLQALRSNKPHNTAVRPSRLVLALAVFLLCVAPTALGFSSYVLFNKSAINAPLQVQPIVGTKGRPPHTPILTHNVNNTQSTASTKKPAAVTTGDSAATTSSQVTPQRLPRPDNDDHDTPFEPPPHVFIHKHL